MQPLTFCSLCFGRHRCFSLNRYFALLTINFGLSFCYTPFSYSVDIFLRSETLSELRFHFIIPNMRNAIPYATNFQGVKRGNLYTNRGLNRGKVRVKRGFGRTKRSFRSERYPAERERETDCEVMKCVKEIQNMPQREARGARFASGPARTPPPRAALNPSHSHSLTHSLGGCLTAARAGVPTQTHVRGDDPPRLY